MDFGKNFSNVVPQKVQLRNELNERAKIKVKAIHTVIPASQPSPPSVQNVPVGLFSSLNSHLNFFHSVGFVGFEILITSIRVNN